jgi:hypothetical protein
MDRDVRSDPEPTARLSAEMIRPISVFGRNVVLELKFTGRFPDWFRELVRVYGLRQCSAAKYVDGVAMMGENWASNSYVPHENLVMRQKLAARRRWLRRTVARSPETADLSA